MYVSKFENTNITEYSNLFNYLAILKNILQGNYNNCKDSFIVIEIKGFFIILTNLLYMTNLRYCIFYIINIFKQHLKTSTIISCPLSHKFISFKYKLVSNMFYDQFGF